MLLFNTSAVSAKGCTGQCDLLHLQPPCKCGTLFCFVGGTTALCCLRIPCCCVSSCSCLTACCSLAAAKLLMAAFGSMHGSTSVKCHHSSWFTSQYMARAGGYVQQSANRMGSQGECARPAGVISHCRTSDCHVVVAVHQYPMECWLFGVVSSLVMAEAYVSSSSGHRF